MIICRRLSCQRQDNSSILHKSSFTTLFPQDSTSQSRTPLQPSAVVYTDLPACLSACLPACLPASPQIPLPQSRSPFYSSSIQPAQSLTPGQDRTGNMDDRESSKICLICDVCQRKAVHVRDVNYSLLCLFSVLSSSCIRLI